MCLCSGVVGNWVCSVCSVLSVLFSAHSTHKSADDGVHMWREVLSKVFYSPPPSGVTHAQIKPSRAATRDLQTQAAANLRKGVFSNSCMFSSGGEKKKFFFKPAPFGKGSSLQPPFAPPFICKGSVVTSLHVVTSLQCCDVASLL